MTTTTKASPEALFDGGSVVALDIRIWSGASVLHRDQDLPAIAGKLPPKELVADGTKRVIDPAVLNPLDACRKRAEATLKRVGVQFLGGYFVAESELAAALAAIADIEREFGELAQHLADHLDEHFSAWEARHPAWSALLRSARLTPAQVRARCAFGAVTYKVTPPTNADHAQGVVNAIASFEDEVIADAAKEAGRILRSTFTGRMAAVGQRALRPVRALAKKVASLAFAGPRVAALAQQVGQMLASMPATGNLGDEEVRVVVEGLFALADGEPIGPATVPAALEAPEPETVAAPAVIDEQAEQSAPFDFAVLL